MAADSGFMGWIGIAVGVLGIVGGWLASILNRNSQAATAKVISNETVDTVKRHDTDIILLKDTTSRADERAKSTDRRLENIEGKVDRIGGSVERIAGRMGVQGNQQQS